MLVGKIYKRIGHTLLLTVLLAFFVFAGVFGETNLKAQEDPADGIYGYAWSSNIGWIKLNACNDFPDDPGACSEFLQSEELPNYGVFVNPVNGYIFGYAWSSNIGWIKFGELSGFPEGDGTVSSNTRLSSITLGAESPLPAANVDIIEGWARACVGTEFGDCSTMEDSSEGWDGWISFRGSDYMVVYNEDNGSFDGYGEDELSFAYGSDVVGWVDFSGVTYGGEAAGSPETVFEYQITHPYSEENPFKVTRGLESHWANTITIDLDLLSGDPEGVEMSAEAFVYETESTSSEIMSGWSVSFSPVSCSPDCSVEMTIEVESSIDFSEDVSGSYYIEIEGQSDGETPVIETSEVYIEVVRVACPFEEKDHREIVIFEVQGNNEDIIASDTWSRASRIREAGDGLGYGTFTTELEPGNYDISLASYDGYEGREMDDEYEYQMYHLILRIGSSPYYETNPTGNLLQDLDYTLEVFEVESSLEVQEGTGSIVAFHDAWEFTSDQQVRPICAAFDKSEPEIVEFFVSPAIVPSDGVTTIDIEWNVANAISCIGSSSEGDWEEDSLEPVGQDVLGPYGPEDEGERTYNLECVDDQGRSTDGDVGVEIYPESQFHTVSCQASGTQFVGHQISWEAGIVDGPDGETYTYEWEELPSGSRAFGSNGDPGDVDQFDTVYSTVGTKELRVTAIQDSTGIAESCTTSIRIGVNPAFEIF